MRTCADTCSGADALESVYMRQHRQDWTSFRPHCRVQGLCKHWCAEGCICPSALIHVHIASLICCCRVSACSEGPLRLCLQTSLFTTSAPPCALEPGCVYDGCMCQSAVVACGEPTETSRVHSLARPSSGRAAWGAEQLLFLLRSGPQAQRPQCVSEILRAVTLRNAFSRIASVRAHPEGVRDDMFKE